MGMTDLETQLSDAQVATGGTGVIVCTHKYDLGVAGTLPRAFQAPGTPHHDPGGGKGLFLDVRVVETFDSVEEDATCAFELVTDGDSALGSPTIHQSTGAIAEATLVAGYQVRLGPLPHIKDAERYLGIQMRVAVHAFTAGKIDASLVLDSTNIVGA